jgi:SAM-dependent methyltransferase
VASHASRSSGNASGSCPLCSGQSDELFSVPCDYRQPRTSKPRSVAWCKACDFGYVWPRPSTDDILSAYRVDDYYTHLDSRTSAVPDKPGLLDRLRLHLSWRMDRGRFLSPADALPYVTSDRPRMCEIGCGGGTNLLDFLEHGFSCVGVEPDRAAREAAQRRIDERGPAARAKVSIIEGSAETLPPAVSVDRFDVVVMSHVLEHCLDVDSAMKNAAALLKKGGVLLVEVPNCRSYAFERYHGVWPWADIPRHLRFFTPASLGAVLRKHGLRIAQTKYAGFSRQFSNDWLKEEEHIWQVFDRHGAARASAPPRFKMRAWRLLFDSLMARAERRYDSVRLIALAG